MDRLPPIIAEGFIWCDAEMMQRKSGSPNIGLSEIKRRRLQNPLASHPGLHVGQCTPFYFCARSVMLFLICCANHPDLAYRGGQENIVHLMADLRKTVDWALKENLRWAFTLSNAGSTYFEDRGDLRHLSEINWDAVQAKQWSGRDVSPKVKEGKQAEFLVENRFPWHLVEKVGVCTEAVRQSVGRTVQHAEHKPAVAKMPEWYY